MSDLRAWLREGVQTSDGCSHPIASDIDAADALMSTAADEIDRINAQLAEARDALKTSSELINRMMHVHVAPDECTSYVEASRKWFMENGGSLAAIADQQATNRRALKGKT